MDPLLTVLSYAVCLAFLAGLVLGSLWAVRYLAIETCDAWRELRDAEDER